METNKKRQLWAYAALFCFCGISLAAQRIGGGPMIPPPVTIYGVWYLYILPVLGAVVLTIAAKKRGKYDFLLLLAFEFFLLAWFIVPEGFNNIPFEPSALLFYGTILSLPAIAAFILSGIAYLVIRNK